MNKIGPGHRPEQPLIVVFGGGKGGAGRTTMCAESARSLARQGARILCVDASCFVPTLHVFLHAEEPYTPLEDDDALAIGEPGAHIADYIEPTSHKSIWSLSLASARRYPYTRSKLRARDLILQLLDLDFDWVLIDLPPGFDDLSLGLFTQAHIPVLVCSPEPASVRVTSQFLRACLYLAVSLHPNASQVPEDLLDLLYAQPLELNRYDLIGLAQELGIGWLVSETMTRFETYLLVNFVREGAERDLGHVLAHAWHQELGLFPRFITPVDYEDRRWFYHRRSAGTSTRGDEALSNDIERLVRSLVQIEAVDRRLPRPIPEDPRAHSALRLGIDADTSPNQLRQHCRRLWEGYRREATISLIFSTPQDRQRIAEELEVLYKSSLSLPGEHQPVDPFNLTPSVITSPPSLNPPTEPSWAPPSTGAPPPSKTPSLPTTLGSGPSPGLLIEELRRDTEMSLQELSQRSHIGIKYLAAIEDANLEILPRPVYLRGYLREIARIFDVDSDHLISEYFRLLHAP